MVSWFLVLGAVVLVLVFDFGWWVCVSCGCWFGWVICAAGAGGCLGWFVVLVLVFCVVFGLLLWAVRGLVMADGLGGCWWILRILCLGCWCLCA